MDRPLHTPGTVKLRVPPRQSRGDSYGVLGPMPEARVELARGCPRWILSPLRLPFRHSGWGHNSRGIESPAQGEDSRYSFIAHRPLDKCPDTGPTVT